MTTYDLTGVPPDLRHAAILAAVRAEEELTRQRGRPPAIIAALTRVELEELCLELIARPQAFDSGLKHHGRRVLLESMPGDRRGDLEFDAGRFREFIERAIRVLNPMMVVDLPAGTPVAGAPVTGSVQP